MTNHELKLIKECFHSDSEIENAIRRLNDKEPLAYILGEWYFYDEVYKVTPDVLIPRSDTEHLVDKLINILPSNGRFADLCTGSGCIAVSVLCHRKDCTAAAYDISEKALEIAAYNAQMNGVEQRIEFHCSDVLSSDFKLYEKFDVIVSNPPYIRKDVIPTLEAQVQYEPVTALDGGADGLDFYSVLTSERFKTEFVKKGGFIVLEIGYDQAEALHSLTECEIFKDYGGNDRVAVIKC